MKYITVKLTEDQLIRLQGSLENSRLTTTSKEDSAFIQRIQRILVNSKIMQS
jgi:hypothetical protein